MPREKTKIALPTEYNGRCSGDTRYISFYPTFGQSSKLPEDSKYPGYECRLPIPTTDEESGSFYNLTIDDLVVMGLKKLSTDLDGGLTKKGEVIGVKGIIFDNIDEPITMKDDRATDDTSKVQHIAAQEWLDDWRWSEKAKADKRAISASAVEQDMIEFGIITADEVGQYDANQLRAKLREAMSKKKKK